jgi:hypothetical protein
MTERALQAQILARLATTRRPLLALPIPNGVWIPARSAAERALVARLIARMKADGMLVPGAPDLVLLWPGGGALVELKRPPERDLFGRARPKGRLSAAQTALAERARRLGINYAVVTGWDELEARLSAWGVP